MHAFAILWGAVHSREYGGGGVKLLKEKKAEKSIRPELTRQTASSSQQPQWGILKDKL